VISRSCAKLDQCRSVRGPLILWAHAEGLLHFAHVSAPPGARGLNDLAGPRPPSMFL